MKTKELLVLIYLIAVFLVLTACDRTTVNITGPQITVQAPVIDRVPVAVPVTPPVLVVPVTEPIPVPPTPDTLIVVVPPVVAPVTEPVPVVMPNVPTTDDCKPGLGPIKSNGRGSKNIDKHCEL